MKADPHVNARNTPTRAQHAAVWFGLLGVPLVWMAHVLICTGLVEIACAGGVAQRNALPWSVAHWLLALASAAACALALSGVLATRRAWRDTKTANTPHRETFHFVAWCGSAISIAFSIGLIFTMAVLLVLPMQRVCESLR
jgi:hypothetical protein